MGKATVYTEALRRAATAMGGEARLAEKSVSVRCLQRGDGSVPVSRDEPDLVAVVGRSY